MERRYDYNRHGSDNGSAFQGQEIPVQGILSALFADLGVLIRKEIALGQEEVKAKVARTMSGLIWVAVGAVLLLGAMFAAIAGLIYLLASYGYTLHASAFLVALGLAIIGVALMLMSKSALTSGLFPSRTADNISRDIRTIKEHAR